MDANQSSQNHNCRMINAVAVLLILLLQSDVLMAKPNKHEHNTTTTDNITKTTVKLLVKFKPTSSSRNSDNLRSFTTPNNNGGSVNHSLNTKLRSVSNISDKGHLASVDVYPEDKEIVIHELRNNDDVLLVEEDFEIYKSPAIEDQEDEQQQYNTTGNLRRTLEEVEQYGNRLIQANELLTTVSSQPNRYINTPVKICIIDTGYNIDHEDLPKDQVTQTDVGYGSAFFDNDGHGTHCAGVIGATGGNQRGVVGVMPKESMFSFHIVKALDDEGIGTAVIMLRALQGCIDNGSKIISMSIGGGLNSAIFRDEFERAYNEGILLVSASGNQGEAVHDYPASYAPVISVGAVDRHGNRAEFSNYNNQVELMAPGVSIKSTHVSGGYRSLSGTSMATPYVAGALALVWGYFPTCSNQQIRNVFARTARRISQDPTGCDEKNGYGIIQAKAAFDALNQFGCEFGGEDSIPKSLDAFGGCQQIQSRTGKTLASTMPPTEKMTSPPFLPLSTSASPSNPMTLSNITVTPTVAQVTSYVSPSIDPTFIYRPSASPTTTSPRTYPPTVPSTSLPLTSSPTNSVSLTAFATTLTSLSPTDRASSNPTASSEPISETAPLSSSAASTNMSSMSPSTMPPIGTLTEDSVSPTQQPQELHPKIFTSPASRPPMSLHRYPAYLSSYSPSTLSPAPLHLVTSLIFWVIWMKEDLNFL